MSRELKIRSNLHPQNFASFSFSKCQLLSSYLNAYVITFIFSAKNCTYCKYKSGKLFSKSCVKPFWFICIECDCYIILLPMSRQGLVSHVASLKFDTIVWSITENMKQLWTKTVKIWIHVANWNWRIYLFLVSIIAVYIIG